MEPSKSNAGDETLSSVELPDTRASSVTLDFSNTQVYDPMLDPEAISTEAFTRPSIFHPLQPGGPHLRSRPLDTIPQSLRQKMSKVKKEQDGVYLPNSLPQKPRPIYISDDEQMDENFQKSTESNRRSSRESTTFEEKRELSNKYSTLNLSKRPYEAESSNNLSTRLAPMHNPMTKLGRLVDNVNATQLAMLRKTRHQQNIRAAKQNEEPQSQINGSISSQRAEDDLSWMAEATVPDEEYDDLVRQVETLQQKERNGKITNAEKILLTKSKRELLLKNRLKKAAAQAETHDSDDDSLFVPDETRNEAAERHTRGVPRAFEKNMSTVKKEDGTRSSLEDANLEIILRKAIEDGSKASSSLEAKTERGKKPRKKVAKNAREVFERDQQKHQNKERRKALKKSRQPVRKVAKKSTTSKKRKGGVKAKKDLEKHFRSFAFTKSGGGVDVLAQRILNDLKSSDQIADRINDPIFNIEPEEQIVEGNKQSQLRKLLDNIPHNSNRTKAKSDQSILLQASKSFGYARVKAVDGKWLVKGMKSTLYHHQLTGAQWMLSRELGQAPFGGLLADGMGLGKTVQMLACMVGNLPQDEDLKRRRKATLIVAPCSLLDQWMDEIRVHAEKSLFPKIVRYTSRSNLSTDVLEDLDIVVVSYTEVMRQMPFPDQKTLKEIGKRGYANWLKKAYDQLGPLHKISWYRVVLDEAHTIKNNAARTSVACQNLKSLYKWCLTGTPILNRLEE